MRKFDVLLRTTDVFEFANIVYNLSHEVTSYEELAQKLSEDFPQEGLQILIHWAENGSYPLSLQGMQ